MQPSLMLLANLALHHTPHLYTRSQRRCPDRETVERGASGGIGEGPQIERQFVSIDDKAMGAMNIADFCKKYDLGDDIKNFLEAGGLSTPDALLDLTNAKYKEMNVDFKSNEMNFEFMVGHIAEIKWAVKKWVLETSNTFSGVADSGPKHLPVIAGGAGGAGGHGGRIGGGGGFGGAPAIEAAKVHLFREIRGGVGGAGGSAGSVTGSIGTHEEPNFQNSDATRDATTGEEDAPNLFGGEGRAGGDHGRTGDHGGVGDAAYIVIEDVGKFKNIHGGLGGAGGRGGNRGGDGGDGGGNVFPKLLFAIDDDTRRRVPPTKLEALNIEEDLRKPLQKHGFRSVGGLFETYDTDLTGLSDFEGGDTSVLAAVLKEVCARLPAEGI
ncbi:hypothetical protein B0H11DRAFT_2205079 [Mycena galericulata]|nr:hypothetical protein B0H11DRAFT_2205079 [Mycena galericulata]